MNGRLIAVVLSASSLVFSSLAFAAPDIETQQGRDQERTRIEAERSAADAKFEVQDRECQTRFIVTSCRNSVRLDRLRTHDELKRQEVILNRLDRRDAAARQQQKIDAKAP